MHYASHIPAALISLAGKKVDGQQNIRTCVPAPNVLARPAPAGQMKQALMRLLSALVSPCNERMGAVLLA